MQNVSRGSRARTASQLCRVVRPTVQTDTQCMDYHSPKRVPIYGIRASIQSSISMDARRGVTGRGGASLQSHVESGEGVWEEGLLMWHTHPSSDHVDARGTDCGQAARSDGRSDEPGRTVLSSKASTSNERTKRGEARPSQARGEAEADASTKHATGRPVKTHSMKSSPSGTSPGRQRIKRGLQ